jgi:uncharacterized membrane protein
MGAELAVAVFPTVEGAERVFADVREDARGAPWLDEVALVEHHRSGRLVVRGTIAGHYLDVEEDGDVMGRGTATGALTGGLAGLVFGPPAVAVGLVGGAAAGGTTEAGKVTPLQGELFTEIRGSVPEGGSAQVLLAEPEHVDAMIDSLRGTDARVAVRRTLSADAMAALEDLLHDAPPASGAQPRSAGSP